jgi:hypothetical protein
VFHCPRSDDEPQVEPTGNRRCHLWFSGRENCGITISRRPNSRESIENAPGPRRPKEAAMTATRTAAIRPSEEPKESMGTTKKAAAAQHIVPSTPPTGVKNPSKRDKPLATAINAKVTVDSIAVSDPARVEKPASTSTIALVARNNRRPIPGDPPGNVENSRCSVFSFADSIVLRVSRRN